MLILLLEVEPNFLHIKRKRTAWLDIQAKMAVSMGRKDMKSSIDAVIGMTEAQGAETFSGA